MRRLCQLESVPCESVSIRRTVCPAWIAARARPIASVLLPLPPFWVASTIVCIVNPSECLLRDLRLRHTELHRGLRCRAILAQDVPARSRNLQGIAAVRITNPCDDDC